MIKITRKKNKLNSHSNYEYYFAYGSNMDEQKIKIQRGISFYEKFSGKLYDWKLVFNKISYNTPGVAYSNISPKMNSYVEGIIYKINCKDILDKLDKFEGFPIHYEKKYLSIESSNKLFECLVYIANPIKTQYGLKPEKKYLNEILAGKKFLSNSYYSQLKIIPTYD